MVKVNLKGMILLGTSLVGVNACGNPTNPNGKPTTGSNNEKKKPREEGGTRNNKSEYEFTAELFEEFKNEKGETLVGKNSQSTISNIKSFISETTSKLKEKEGELTQLNDEKSTYTEILEKLKKEHTEAIKPLNLEIKEKEARISELEQQLSQLGTTSPSTSQIKSNNASKEALELAQKHLENLTQVQKELSELKAEKDILETEKNNLETKKEQEIISLKSKISDNESKILDLTDELQKEKDKVTELEKNIKEAEENLKKETDELNKKIDAVNKKKEALEVKIVENEGTINSLDQEKTKLNNDISEKELLINQNKKTIDDLNLKYKEETEKLTSDIETKKQEIFVIKAELETTKTALDAEKAKILKDLNVNDETKKQIAAKEEDIEKLKTDLQSKANNHNDEINKIKRKQKKSEEELSSLKNQLNEKDSEILQLKNNNEKYKKANEDFEKGYKELADKYKIAETKIKELNDLLKTNSTNFKKLQEINKNLVEENKSLSEDNEGLQKKNAESLGKHKTEIENIENKISELKKNLENEKTQNQNLTGRNENLEKYNTEKDIVILNKTSEILELTTKINTLEQEIVDLKITSEKISEDKDTKVKNLTKQAELIASLNYNYSLYKKMLADLFEATNFERLNALKDKTAREKQIEEDIKMQREELEKKIGPNADFSKITNAEEGKIYWQTNQEKGKGETKTDVNTVLDSAKKDKVITLTNELDKDIKINNCAVTFNGDKKIFKKQGQSEIFKNFISNNKLEDKQEEKLQNILYLLTDDGILKTQKEILKTTLNNNSFALKLIDDASRKIDLEIIEGKLELTCTNNYSLANLDGISIKCTSIYKEGNAEIETNFEVNINSEVNQTNYEAITKEKESLLDLIKDGKNIKNKGKFIYDLCNFLNIGPSQFIKNKLYPIVYASTNENPFSAKLDEGTLGNDVNSVGTLLKLFDFAKNKKNIDLNNIYWSDNILPTYINTLNEDEGILVPIRIENDTKESYALMYIGPDFKIEEDFADLNIDDDEDLDESFENLNEENEVKEEINSPKKKEPSKIKSQSPKMGRFIKFIGIPEDKKESSFLLFGKDSKISLKDLTNNIAVDNLEFIKGKDGKYSFVEISYIMSQLLDGKLEREFLQDKLEKLENISDKLAESINNQFNVLDKKYRESIEENGGFVEYNAEEYNEIPDLIEQGKPYENLLDDMAEIEPQALTTAENDDEVYGILDRIKNNGSKSEDLKYSEVLDNNYNTYKDKSQNLETQINNDATRSYKYYVTQNNLKKPLELGDNSYEALKKAFENNNTEQVDKYISLLQQGVFTDSYIFIQNQLGIDGYNEKSKYTFNLQAFNTTLSEEYIYGEYTGSNKENDSLVSFELEKDTEGKIIKIKCCIYYTLLAVPNGAYDSNSNINNAIIKCEIEFDINNERANHKFEITKVNKYNDIQKKIETVSLINKIDTESTLKGNFINNSFENMGLKFEAFEAKNSYPLFNAGFYVTETKNFNKQTLDTVFEFFKERKENHETKNNKDNFKKATELLKEILVFDNNESNKIYNDKFIEKITDINFEGKIVIPFGISPINFLEKELTVSIPHSVALVIDVKTKKVYYYDPMGAEKGLVNNIMATLTFTRKIGDEEVSDYLKKQAKNIGFEYAPVKLNNQADYISCVKWTFFFVAKLVIDGLSVEDDGENKGIESLCKKTNKNQMKEYLISILKKEQSEEYELLEIEKE